MDWTLIEVKWAAMARRVRADLPDHAANSPDQSAPVPQPGDLPDPTPPDLPGDLPDPVPSDPPGDLPRPPPPQPTPTKLSPTHLILTQPQEVPAD